METSYFGSHRILGLGRFFPEKYNPAAAEMKRVNLSNGQAEPTYLSAGRNAELLTAEARQALSFRPRAQRLRVEAGLLTG